jgi:hypothetical protein
VSHHLLIIAFQLGNYKNRVGQAPKSKTKDKDQCGMEEDMLFRLPQSILNVQSFRNG